MCMRDVEKIFKAALACHQAGRLAEAQTLYRQILAQQAAHAGALHFLGVIEHQAGHNQGAVDLIGQAIALRPNYAEAYSNLATALRAMGQFDEAIAACRQAIALRPNYPEAFNTLGNSLRDRGQLDEGIEAYRQAVALRPNYAEVHNNLGNALRDAGELEEAVAACARAIALRANYPQAFANLGNALRDLARLEEAVAAYRQAIALDPNLPETYNNLANALRDQGQLEEAMALYRQAIALKPDYAQAYSNLGNALKDAGQLDEAIAAYRQAIGLEPDYAAAHSNLVYTIHFHPRYDALAIAQELSCWNRQHAEPLKQFIKPHANDRNPDRRLRIGYVSPDFFRQSEAYFVVPLMEAHDHAHFEIHCYTSVLRPDEITQRLGRCADVWHDVRSLCDPDLAEQIRRDGIDILVDLTMHMAGNRLLVFARKPAPLQFTWLAYPGSTGLRSIDYRLTDAYLDPPGLFDDCYSETSIRLAECWCCYDPLIQLECRSTRRAGPVCFGSLNNPCKLNPATLQLWARIMKAVADSRLLLLVESPEQRARISRLFEQAGIAPHRVQFTPRLPRADYLRLYDQIDIGLDTLPYNGITTTCDALWMGVPVISLCGRTAAGRAGLSILTTVGLQELVADSEEMYVRIASELAKDIPRLSQLRSTLRQRMQQSPLMDASRFARNVEAAYRRMWRTWCGGLTGIRSSDFV